MPQLIGLDFETYAATDLPKHGLARYLRDKTFTPLIGSVAWDTGILGIDTHRFDFVNEMSSSKKGLREAIGSSQIVAHNAPFEEGVLTWLGLDYPSTRFIDSAVVARCAGAASKLEAAAPQLLGIDKMAEGKGLMRLFSMPGEYQEKNGNMLFDPRVIEDHPDKWEQYGVYCDLDATLGLRIATDWSHRLTPEEMSYQAVTMDMARVGWTVDLDLAEEMQRRYHENLEVLTFQFRLDQDASELNLASLKQLKEWCAERGVKATSFDEAHVTAMLRRLTKRLADTTLDKGKREGYESVVHLLQTKQALGGSSLKKLKVLLDTVDEDTWRPGNHRLRDQYLHAGAGQSLRTTGRSFQMQNLKQLNVVADMEELEDPAIEWDNTKLAENMRQLFTSSDPNGVLMVGDLKSVESRGLAWSAGAWWKTNAYQQGQDLYKVLASKIYAVRYDAVTKEQRQAGKVGELACGYGAGGEAVRAFATKMGIELEEGEATKLVWDWRAANPEIVAFWTVLDDMLKLVVEGGLNGQLYHLSDDMQLMFTSVKTPESLEKQHPNPNQKSVMMSVTDGNGKVVMRRYFLGCYIRGRNVCYYRPSDRKTGDLWKNHYVDPKTKEVRFYELYGGKLAGILTQSLCREIFFAGLKRVHQWAREQHPGQIELVGQFHDEIVVDWRPGALSLEGAAADLRRMMSDAGLFRSFPLDAEIKWDYRYIK